MSLARLQYAISGFQRRSETLPQLTRSSFRAAIWPPSKYEVIHGTERTSLFQLKIARNAKREELTRLAIEIMPPSKQRLKRMTTKFALQQDNWNDYSFRTLYHLHFRHGGDPEDVTYVGGVKILRKGQKASGAGLVDKPFNKLSDEWISVGTSLDYYQRMNELPPTRRRAIMDALNDAVAHPDLVPLFEG